MSNETEEMVRMWAEHAAKPFQGLSREDCEKQISIAIGTAIKAGAPIIEGISDAVFAYDWDDENNISVITDQRLMTGQMLIIRGK